MSSHSHAQIHRRRRVFVSVCLVIINDVCMHVYVYVCMFARVERTCVRAFVRTRKLKPIHLGLINERAPPQRTYAQAAAVYRRRRRRQRRAGGVSAGSRQCVYAMC